MHVLQLGYSLPSSLLEHIKTGAPFKAAFDAPENEPDASWNYKPGLRWVVELKERERNAN